MPTHMAYKRNVPMYNTKIPFCSAGVFKSATYMVSMRLHPLKMVEHVRDIARSYMATHGEPIDWGWDALERLGIKDFDKPNYGDSPVGSGREAFTSRGLGDCAGDEHDLVPIFWGCGVTPQQAVMHVGLKGTIIGHAPEHMLVLDIRDWDVVA